MRALSLESSRETKFNTIKFKFITIDKGRWQWSGQSEKKMFETLKEEFPQNIRKIQALA